MPTQYTMMVHSLELVGALIYYLLLVGCLIWIVVLSVEIHRDKKEMEKLDMTTSDDL